MRIPTATALIVLASLSGCYAPAPPPLPAPAPAPPPTTSKFTEIGLASWYAPDFNEKHTANGEPYDRNALTAAHRTLPLNTRVRVTNLENGRSVVVRINDRGPHERNRIIDLSERAALALGIGRNGVVRVRIEIASPAEAGL